jgi:hypothetical protein
MNNSIQAHTSSFPPTLNAAQACLDAIDINRLYQNAQRATALGALITDIDVSCKSFSHWWNKAKMRPLKGINT